MIYTERYEGVVDRSGWESGPWDGEPDKAVWVDEATGLDCMIVRQERSGHLCGYVGVGPDHPWHGVGYYGCVNEACTADEDESHYECSPDSRVSVHGGVTFAEGCIPDDSGPERGICHIEQPGRPDPVWWFGFDCRHFNDRSPKHDTWEQGEYRTYDYVQGEVQSLAAQIAGVR